MRALVTGATGFLGGHLARRLAEEGWRVTATGRRDGAALTALGMAYHPADLSDSERMTVLCAGQDVVFHCGARSSAWGPYDDFYRSNVLGTRSVIAGCAAHGVQRLVHISTPSLYFDFRDRYRIREDETLPPRPVNAYAATKRLAEREVATAHARGLPTIILRPRAIFGPGDRTILPRLIAANARAGVPLIRDGRALLDVTYVSNVVDAALCAAHAPPEALGRAYNISNGAPMSFLALVRALFDRLDAPLRLRRLPWPVASTLARAVEAAARLAPGDREPPFTRYSLGVLAFSQTLDLRAAHRDLGYAPRVGIPEGLDRFAKDWNASTPGATRE